MEQKVVGMWTGDHSNFSDTRQADANSAALTGLARLHHLLFI
jgi:hypothetical protein